MTQETARDTPESVAEALEQAEDPESTQPLKELADGDRDPSELDWEDWTHPVKILPSVVLELRSCGVGVRWFDVRNDLIHVNHGGKGGWVQVLPGNLRSQLNRARSSSRVEVRPVLRGETPTAGGEGQ